MRLPGNAVAAGQLAHGRIGRAVQYGSNDKGLQCGLARLARSLAPRTSGWPLSVGHPVAQELLQSEIMAAVVEVVGLAAAVVDPGLHQVEDLPCLATL